MHGVVFKKPNSGRLPAVKMGRNGLRSAAMGVWWKTPLIALHALDESVQAGIEGGGVFAVGEVA